MILNLETARGFQSTLSSRRATCAWASRPANGSNFNPRSPHGERRFVSASSALLLGFQSTLSSRRATGRFRSVPLEGRYFNPRSPHGERPPVRSPRPTATPNFNPRSPHGERHYTAGSDTGRTLISIHALLTESDHGNWLRRHAQGDFNPRSPHGERPMISPLSILWTKFQSTLSSRRATILCQCR